MRERTLGPTPERLKKAGDAVEVSSADESEHWRAVRLTDDKPLEYLQSRDLITSDQYQAGSMFYRDWYMGLGSSDKATDPSRIVVDGGGYDPIEDRRLFCLHRWKRAVQAVGLVHSTVLTDVVLHGIALHEWGTKFFGQKNRERARQAGITATILALEALVIHYYGPRKGGIRTVHVAQDYRPDILAEVEGSE